MEQDEIGEITFYLRMFPLTLSRANTLLEILSEFSVKKYALPNSNKYNIVLKMGDNFSIERFFELTQGKIQTDCIDVFISMVPKRDSIIKEIPRYVVDAISLYRCRLFFSFTAGY